MLSYSAAIADSCILRSEEKCFCENLHGMEWGGGSDAEITSVSFENRNKSQLQYYQLYQKWLSACNAISLGSLAFRPILKSLKNSRLSCIIFCISSVLIAH
jgi:hypothetical protein